MKKIILLLSFICSAVWSQSLTNIDLSVSKYTCPDWLTLSDVEKDAYIDAVVTAIAAFSGVLAADSPNREYQEISGIRYAIKTAYYDYLQYSDLRDFLKGGMLGLAMNPENKNANLADGLTALLREYSRLKK
jgi:hypothetical protein